MTIPFASSGDLADKEARFVELAPGAFAYTAQGDPNSGVIVGDDCALVVDAQATPLLARRVIERVRAVTDLPIRHLVLSHYHAVRTLGASAYGASQTIASRGTWELLKERGAQDQASELARFPRLFQGAETIPGLTWPTLVFDGALVLWLGRRRVEIRHLGRGHTAGDTVVWLPEEGVVFAGDLVEWSATPYTGDAYLRDWPATLGRLQALEPRALVPGRGEALTSAAACRDAITATRCFVERLYETAAAARRDGASLRECFARVDSALRPRFGDWVIFEHCLPFDASRAYDEAGGIEHPRIWTAERDRELWQALHGTHGTHGTDEAPGAR